MFGYFKFLLVGWKKFHSLLRKAYLGASNVNLGGVGMSWVFQCDRPHDAF